MILQPCGTRAAYMRHLAAGEIADDACLAAERQHKTAQRAARRQARELQDYLFRQVLDLIAGVCREEGMLP